MPSALLTRLAFVFGLWCTLATAPLDAAEPEFQSIFDGRTLAEWSPGNPEYWTVEDGSITGRISRERPCTTNQYLVWKGGELADFELKMEVRLNGEGGINGGFQFRSRLLPDHDVCGYQMDNNLRTEWLVRLYDEYGRHDLALRGERTAIDQTGRKTVQPIPSAKGPAHFRLEDWHEYHLTCLGPKITLRVNGELVAEVEDHDPRRAEPQGILALQLHSGPPTVVQFRNLRLKVLKNAEAPVAAHRPAQPNLFEQVSARWLFDVGGHGAQPGIRLVPEFYKFELNVRPAGPGARPQAKVALLDGAYLDAGKELHVSGDQLTVYLRLRDPAGEWNSALIGKGAGRDLTHFNLFGAGTPDGSQIAFQVRTENGFAEVSFPKSRIDATAWHDLFGRYDGSTLALFCDGQLMDSKPLTGSLARNAEPLLIGAELQGGQVKRHFRGELEESAIWPRGLLDADIKALSSRSP